MGHFDSNDTFQLVSHYPISTVFVYPVEYLAHHWGREMVFESCIPLHSLSGTSDSTLKHLVRSAVRKYAELCGFGISTTYDVHKRVRRGFQLLYQICR